MTNLKSSYSIFSRIFPFGVDDDAPSCANAGINTRKPPQRSAAMVLTDLCFMLSPPWCRGYSAGGGEGGRDRQWKSKKLFPRPEDLQCLGIVLESFFHSDLNPNKFSGFEVKNLSFSCNISTGTVFQQDFGSLVISFEQSLV